ncbi:hypothetical protein PHMEG_00032661 [Phytophthora megakarya]|uniref:Uncharacterized protein n=1 Tax=Phytophthora megakarya TaxID=4795 RepID=A0A225UV04_9STRA|nr:hypothetical protein PHMEG_00032661 [Phytophthora megakarya]
MCEEPPLRKINATLNTVGLSLSVTSPKVHVGVPSLITLLQSVLSAFVRRSPIKLPQGVGLIRGQTNHDYYPNERMIPEVLNHICEGNLHGNVRIQRITSPSMNVTTFLRIYSEGPGKLGTVIHDLSLPESSSVNGLIDTERICTPEFQRCDAIGTEILQQPEQYSDAEILLQASDVTQPFEMCAYAARA